MAETLEKEIVDEEVDTSTEDVDTESEIITEEPTTPTETLVNISELRKVRAEAAKWRKQLRLLEAKVNKKDKEAELASMEETDRLKAIAAQAEAETQSLRVRAEKMAITAAIVDAASALRFHHPKDAADIIAHSEIDIDEDGNVDTEQVKLLVEQLAEERPYFIMPLNEAPAIPNIGGPSNPKPPADRTPKVKFTDQDFVDRQTKQATDEFQQGRKQQAVRTYNQAWERKQGLHKQQETMEVTPIAVRNYNTKVDEGG